MNSTSHDSVAPPGSDAAGRSIRERELRGFGLVLGALFAAIFGVLLPILHRRAIPLWPWALGAILAAAALLRPALLEYLHRGWNALGTALGWVNTRIILSALFYVVITPMGLIGRSLGLLAIKRPGGEPTYREPSHQISRSSFERPF